MCDDAIEEMILNYVIGTWYESKCKRKEDIQKIIREELEKRPNFQDMNMNKLCLIIKRRCMAEL